MRTEREAEIGTRQACHVLFCAPLPRFIRVAFNILTASIRQLAQLSVLLYVRHLRLLSNAILRHFMSCQHNDAYAFKQHSKMKGTATTAHIPDHCTTKQNNLG